MNRRQAIKAACATVAMPSHLILSSPPERIFSVASGDLGRVYLDGRQVKAIACCPDEGWVECFADENGRPLGLSEIEYHKPDLVRTTDNRRHTSETEPCEVKPGDDVYEGPDGLWHKGKRESGRRGNVLPYAHDLAANHFVPIIEREA